MRQKLKIDPSAASLEDSLSIRRSLAPWVSGHKLGVLEGLLLQQDAGCSRTKYAAANGISARTLQRWIQQVNAGGLLNALEPVHCGPGRKRKLSLSDFRNRILPMVRRELHQSGRSDTIKNLYQSARSLSLVDSSYATFRRRLRQTNSSYKRRKVEPTIDEWMFHAKTGQWPKYLKAYGRRRAKQEQLAWQKFRAEIQQEKARWKVSKANFSELPINLPPK